MSAPAIISSGTAAGGPPVGGSGTIDTIPRWSGVSTLGDSLLSQSGAIVTNSGTFRAASGAVSEPAYTFSASSGTGMYRATSGALLRFAVSGAYAFGVDTNGNVGIGTASPSYKLDVISAEARIGASAPGANTFLYLGNGVTSAGPYGVGALQFSGQAHTAVFANSGYGAARASLGMVSGGVYTPALSADPSGNVGIGTASPGALLDVNTGTAAGSYVTSTRLSQTGTAANSGQRILFHNSAQAWDQGAIGSLREGANNNFALTFFTSIAGTNTERARIDSSGNVGIGTATPNSTAGIGLTIYQAAAGSLYLQNATDIARIFQQPTNLYIDSSVGSASGSIIFRRGSTVTESARIDSAGRFGIGTASPDSTLHVVGAASSQLRIGFNGLSQNYYDAGDHFFRSAGGVANRMSITSSFVDVSFAGYGLKLPATPGNADTQTLDCYQEGTWAPTLAGFGGTNPTVTASYTRVGRLVTIAVQIDATGGNQYSMTLGTTTITTPAGMTASSICAVPVVDGGVANRGIASVWTTGIIYLPTVALTTASTFFVATYRV